MIMKKLLIITVSILAVGLTGCLKDQYAVDLYATGNPLLEFEYPQGGAGVDIGSGLEYFAGAALTYPSSDVTDTAFFIVNLASTNTLNKDISVTLSIDNSALQANFSNDSIPYETMPDSLYTLLSTTGTIKAGTRQDTFYIVFYPSKINTTHNYGLPITMTDAQGIPISGNFGYIYIHTIGNPIAGAYTEEWIRYNTATMTGTPAFDELFDNVFSPVNPTTISVQSEGTGVVYLLSFTDSSGVLTDFKVAFDPASVTAAGITITSGPFVVAADPANHTYTFNFTYNNSAGSARNITDIFH
jgi:hypothetical protein